MKVFEAGTYCLKRRYGYRRFSLRVLQMLIPVFEKMQVAEASSKSPAFATGPGVPGLHFWKFIREVIFAGIGIDWHY